MVYGIAMLIMFYSLYISALIHHRKIIVIHHIKKSLEVTQKNIRVMFFIKNLEIAIGLIITPQP